jgi:hypothetical protein
MSFKSFIIGWEDTLKEWSKLVIVYWVVLLGFFHTIPSPTGKHYISQYLTQESIQFTVCMLSLMIPMIWLVLSRFKEMFDVDEEKEKEQSVEKKVVKKKTLRGTIVLLVIIGGISIAYVLIKLGII